MTAPLDVMILLRSYVPATLELSLVTDSDAIGSDERTVRSVEEMVRTHAVNMTANCHRSPRHGMDGCLHAAAMVRKGVTGTCGKTPSQRLKGQV